MPKTVQLVKPEIQGSDYLTSIVHVIRREWGSSEGAKIGQNPVLQQ
jgi:hypothetical protein